MVPPTSQQPAQSQLPLDFSVTMVNIKLNNVNVCMSPNGGSSNNNNNNNNNNISVMIGKGGNVMPAHVTDENTGSSLNGANISRPMSPSVLLTTTNSAVVQGTGSSNGSAMTSAFKVVTPRGKADGYFIRLQLPFRDFLMVPTDITTCLKRFLKVARKEAMDY
uniref:Uncharacterized protein n=1 Tax=Anopheles farauti TaxID=69004 RepID=A0A182Q9F1_9DIPT